MKPCTVCGSVRSEPADATDPTTRCTYREAQAVVERAGAWMVGSEDGANWLVQFHGGRSATLLMGVCVTCLAAAPALAAEPASPIVGGRAT